MPPVSVLPRPTHLLVVGFVLCLVLVAVVTAPAEATSGVAGSLLANLDDARTARGLAPLAPADDLEAVATAHSRAMAESGDLHHNPSLGQDVANWRVVAENVGRGPDAGVLHDMFMDSPTHAANILDERVTQVGIGVVAADDGQLWVTQVFRQPLGASAPAPAPRSAAPPSDATPPPVVTPPPGPTPVPPAPVVGVAAATTTRTAPAPAAIGVAAATTTATAPAPTEDHEGGGGLLAAAARWVARLF